MDTRVHNFSAGPAALPLPVLEQAQRELLSLPGLGMSVMEISHRGKVFTEIIQSATANLRTLLKLPDNYKILYLQGGASMQFSMIPTNLLRGSGKPADYILTGVWGSKAIKEAQKEGTTRVAWTGKADGFVRVPKNSELDLDPNAAYVHFTSNETIEGVEFFAEPEVGAAPLVCDASSDFLSRPIPMDKYGLIYAGAQKNVGPSGLAVVIIREDLLARIPAGLPSMLDYRVAAENDSLYNTPPTFGIYMVGLVAKWLLETVGGLDKMEIINRKKAELLYAAIDASAGFYKGHATPESRSIMNVTFRLPDEALEKEFVKQAEARGLSQLKGHRSVGGIRASIYNAITVESVQALVAFMEEFRKGR
jgi:phosphoserine aminotransferase